MATTRMPKTNPHVEKIYAATDTASVVEQADYLVLVAPLTDDTRGLFDASMIARMKPDAVMINLSRGGIVDEAALVKALTDGAIKGAAIDVFEQEPLPGDHPLWDAPNTLITPHMAAADNAYLPNIAKIFAENLKRIASGDPLINEVDRGRGY